eukprot:14373895-Ditylum_brightwellii.AAC.1
MDEACELPTAFALPGPPLVVVLSSIKVLLFFILATRSIDVLLLCADVAHEFLIAFALPELPL